METKLLFELAEMYSNIIAENVKTELIKLNHESHLLSGDDSGLKNIWEEICVQVQHEESNDWHLHLDLMDNLVQNAFEVQPKSIKRLLNYIGSLDQNDFENDEECVLNDEYGIKEIRNNLIKIADNYTNTNISNYINGEEYDEDEEEFKDDDEYEDDEEKN